MECKPLANLFKSIILLFAVSISSYGQDADVVLQKYLEAIGGADRLRQVDKVYLVSHIPNRNQGRFLIEEFSRPFGLVRSDSAAGQSKILRTFYDGKEGYTLRSGVRAPFPNKTMKVYSYIAMPFQELDNRKAGITYGVAKDTTVDGTRCSRVEVYLPDNTTAFRYYDQGTGLLKFKDELDSLGKLSYRIIYSDYKKIGGLFLPTKHTYLKKDLTPNGEKLIDHAYVTYHQELVPPVTSNNIKSDPGKRVALVIGVRSYNGLPPLKNTLNDAQDMSKTLTTLGFKVFSLYDPKTKHEIQNSIREYFKMLNENKQTVGFFYYSGHGMQIDGSNYLIPANVDLQIKADVSDQCLNMDYIMSAFESAGNDLNIFIMDACRNNPFKGFDRSSDKGLIMTAAPKGTYVVYATKPGSVASDGTGRNGLFTSKLLSQMSVPNLTLEQAFKRAAFEIDKESGGNQRPWIASDFTGEFYFVKP